MHPRDLALTGFRIVAVYVGIQGFVYLARLGLLIADQSEPSAINPGVLVSLAPVIIAILLWFLAPRLSAMASAESAAAGHHAELSANDLTRCGLIVVGMFVIVTTLPTLLAQLSTLADPNNTLQPALILTTAGQCLFAVAIVIGADRISRLAMRLKRAGLSR